MAQQVCFEIGTNCNQLYIKAPSLSLFWQYLLFRLSMSNILFLSFDYAETQCSCINRFQAFYGDGCHLKTRTLGGVPTETERHWKAPCDVVKTYLETLDWGMLPRPPYSPDIAPSNYYLFRLMSHTLTEKRFQSLEDIKKWVDSWIASKDEEFFRNGIRKLP